MSKQSNNAALGNVAYVVRTVEGATAIARGNITNRKMNNRPTPETDAVAEKLNFGVDLDFARKLERERDEARERCREAVIYWERDVAKMQGERDEAREEIENLKLQLGLWEDGNIICEETLGEIRLLKEQIDRVLLERNEAHKIANRAIDDIAWFSETNAQRLRVELDQLKESAKCPVCSPEQKCWECADDVSQEGVE